MDIFLVTMSLLYIIDESIIYHRNPFLISPSLKLLLSASYKW